jgi:multicomponent Na+:H+ antiporter subunit D
MSWLLPLPVVIPLLAAAVNTAGDHVLPRRAGDAIAISAAAASFVFSLLIMVQSMQHELTHWFGGWRPRSGVALGIAFTSDPLGAGAAALASGLMLAALVYSLTYLAEAARFYHTLMLVFCGAMCGFALTGDIFNMFVWFELMGVAAYALAGFKVAELGPLQGSINMAVTNTIGAYFILLGIALLYGRTGALNLAQIGRTLSGQHAGGLEVVAFTLLLAGFLIKAAIVPFHAWLADAHAVAPAPVCVLFSGIMVELGLLGVARVYWTIFDAPFGSHQTAVRNLLLVLGIVSALLGAAMAFLQAHLKRLLAYSTISHAGMMLVGIALLDSKSLAGVASLVLSHGLIKASLFLCCGIVLVNFRSIDELRLYGRGRAFTSLGVLFVAGAVGLIGFPYVGTYLGHAQIDEGAVLAHAEWVQPLLMIAAGISAGAILRAGLRVFCGWGPADDELLSRQPPEEPPETEGGTWLLVSVTAVLLALGLVASVVPGLGQRAEYGAERFRDRSAYADRVLHGQPMKQTPARLPFSVEHTTRSSWLYGIGSTLIALATAAFGLWRRRIPTTFRRPAARILDPPVAVLKTAHSGIIGDYVLYVVVGTALVGGIWGLTLR